MAFEELKVKQSAMWGSAPYERVAESVAPAHEHLLRACPARKGEEWLDVATGTGQIALPVARDGARVTGLDLSPELIEAARTKAAAEGVEIAFDVGDAEALPYPDAAFDTISSTFGCMFAPDHRAVSKELARVCRPGGRLALLTWHPERGVPEFFKVMAAYQPPRPDGVGNPFSWGDRDHVTDLLGDSFELRFEEGDCPQTGSSGEDVWELFSNWYGPTKTLADSLDDERREALHRDWVAFFENYRDGDGVSQPRPYLLVLGTRR
jgi:SAM-dependent methyltransferase